MVNHNSGLENIRRVGSFEVDGVASSGQVDIKKQKGETYFETDLDFLVPAKLESGAKRQKNGTMQ